MGIGLMRFDRLYHIYLTASTVTPLHVCTVKMYSIYLHLY